MTGGQDCHGAQKGAHTGDVSADMLKDAGAKWVIVGHSERRAEVKRGGHGETSKLVREKCLPRRWRVCGALSASVKRWPSESPAIRSRSSVRSCVNHRPIHAARDTLSLLMSLSGPSVPA